MLYQVYLVIKQIMDYTLHQRRKNRRMEFPNKWIYRSSSSEEDEMSLSSSAKITTPITKTITPLKSNKATEMDVLIDLPHPFGILPALKFKNDRGFNMDHVYMKRDFLNFIESEELHANTDHNQVLKNIVTQQIEALFRNSTRMIIAWSVSSAKIHVTIFFTDSTVLTPVLGTKNIVI